MVEFGANGTHCSIFVPKLIVVFHLLPVQCGHLGTRLSVLLHDVQNEAVQFALYEEISGLTRAWETRGPLDLTLRVRYQ